MKVTAISVVIILSLSYFTKPKPSDLPQDVGWVQNPTPLIMLAIIDVESKGNPRARRLEPQLMKKHGWPAAWATSYGLTQVVYGYHKDKCGLKSPNDLYNPRTNIACGLRVYNDCLKARGSVSGALGCYNGDRTGRYAKRVLSRVKN